MRPMKGQCSGWTKACTFLRCVQEQCINYRHVSSQIKGCHAAIFSRWKWFFKEGNERHLLLWNLRKLINRPLWRSLQRANNCGVETGQLPRVLTHAFQWHSCPSFTQTLVSSSSSHMLLYTTPVNSSFLQGRCGCDHFS